jgi:hypothetical protein
MFWLIIIFVRHYKLTYSKYENLRVVKTLAVLTLLLSYVFIQLNFDLTSHNFGIKFFFFFNNNLFMLLTLWLLFYLLYRTLLNYSQRVYKFYITSSNYVYLYSAIYWVRTSLLILFFSLLYYTLILSFISIISFFIYSYLKVKLLNYNLVLYTTNVVFVLSLIYPLYVSIFTSKSYLLTVPLITQNYYYTLLLLTTNFTSRVSSIHYNLSIFLILNLLATNYVLSVLLLIPSTFNCVIDSLILNPKTTYYSCNTFIFNEFSYWKVNNNFSTTQSWNMYYAGNNPTLNLFSLSFSNLTFLNLFTIPTPYVSVFYLINLPYSSYYLIITLILLVLTTCIYNIVHFYKSNLY